MRIVLVTDAVGDDPALTTARRDVLLNDVLPEAVSRVSALLRVVPVVGNLFADRTCSAGYFSDGHCAGHSTTAPTCSTSNPSISIPEYMLKEGWEEGTCTSSRDPSTCTTLPAGAGVPNADFVLFVTAEQTPNCPAEGSSGTLAFAATCQRDQTDRPVFGYANFCPFRLPDTSNPADVEPVVGTAIHEMFHALGFSSSSWPLMRDETGTPRTDRHPFFPNRAADDRQLSLPCGGSQLVPDTNVIQTDSSLRGFPCTGELTPGDCPHVFVTPKVQQAARQYFDCDTLLGPELENQPTSSSCRLLGSHWDQRTLETEIMSPVFASDDFEVTAITLALFEDMGWYFPDYSQATPLRVGQDYGFQEGCSFVKDPCLDASQNSAGVFDRFCTDTSSFGAQDACSTDLRHQAFCFAQTTTSTLPVGMQYPDGSGGFLIGSVSERDYCPIYVGFSNGDCRDASNAPVSNHRGMVFGPDSYCVLGTLTTGSAASETSMCVSVSCSEGGVPTVSVEGGASVECPTKGATVSLAGFNGVITCPDPAIVCATPSVYLPSWVASASPTSSVTPTVSVTPTPTISKTSTRSASRTPTETRTPSITPSTGASLSPSTSLSPSVSDTPAPSMSPTSSVSESNPPSTTTTATASRSTTRTASRSMSASTSLASTPSVSESPSASPPLAVDCVVSSDFLEWSTCVGEPCSVSGRQSRSRLISTYPLGDGAPCPSQSELFESRACTLPTTPDCLPCANGVKDDGETDVDCGNADCGGCAEGLTCDVEASDTTCASGTTCSGVGGTCVSANLVSGSAYVESVITLSGVGSHHVTPDVTAALKAAVIAQLSQRGVTLTADNILIRFVSVGSGARRRRRRRRRRRLQTSSTDTVDVGFAVVVASDGAAAIVESSLQEDATPLALRVHSTVALTVPALLTVSVNASSVASKSTASHPLVVVSPSPSPGSGGGGGDGGGGGVSMVLIGIVAGVLVVGGGGTACVAVMLHRRRKSELKRMQNKGVIRSARQSRAQRAALAGRGMVSPMQLGQPSAPAHSKPVKGGDKYRMEDPQGGDKYRMDEETVYVTSPLHAEGGGLDKGDFRRMPSARRVRRASVILNEDGTAESMMFEPEGAPPAGSDINRSRRSKAFQSTPSARW